MDEQAYTHWGKGKEGRELHVTAQQLLSIVDLLPPEVEMRVNTILASRHHDIVVLTKGYGSLQLTDRDMQSVLEALEEKLGVVPEHTTLHGEEAEQHLERVRARAQEQGGFLALHKHPTEGKFQPQQAVFTAGAVSNASGNATSLCLTIEDQQWLFRADEFFSALGHALGDLDVWDEP